MDDTHITFQIILFPQKIYHILMNIYYQLKSQSVNIKVFLILKIIIIKILKNILYKIPNIVYIAASFKLSTILLNPKSAILIF